MTLNLPAERKADLEGIKGRLALSREDGISKNELTALSADAANFLKRELRIMQPEFAKAIPRFYDAETLVRDACTAVSNPDSDLWQAEPSTVLGAVMSAGQLGLRIGVLGHSWILPFWSGRDAMMKAQLIIGYQGYVDLCYRSRLVLDMTSEVVYQTEVDCEQPIRWKDFYWTEDRPHLFHMPDISITSRHSCPICNETDPKCPNVDEHGELIHAFYSQARTKGGGFKVTRPWGLNMMLSHRKRYAKKSRNGMTKGPWWDEFPQMGRKTMIRELTTLLPKSPEIAHALAADEGVRYTYSANVKPGDATEHEHQNLIIDAETLAAETMHPADRM